MCGVADVLHLDGTSSSKASPFTRTEYKALLAQTIATYPCMGFEVLDKPELPEHFALIRHDIDMSVSHALALAEIEAEAGVRATYTILLTGEFYSPFESNTRDMLQKIALFGHDIGLHFDAAWHRIENEEQLEDAISWETSILNRLINFRDGQNVKMFSFHNTTPFTMACKRSHYAGLRNAYAGLLQSDVQYTSDSNGYWIHRSWESLLNEGHKRIQVLTHPEWWGPCEAEPAEKVCRILEHRSQSVWSDYCRLLDQGKRLNKSGLSHADKLLPLLFGDDGDQLVRLWLDGRRKEAFVTLYQRFQCLLREIVARQCESLFETPSTQIVTLLGSHPQLDPLICLILMANTSQMQILGFDETQYKDIQGLYNELILGFAGRQIKVSPRHFDRLSLAAYHLDNWQKQLPIARHNTNTMKPSHLSRSAEEQQSLHSWLQTHRNELRLDDASLDKLSTLLSGV